MNFDGVVGDEDGAGVGAPAEGGELAGDVEGGDAVVGRGKRERAVGPGGEGDDRSLWGAGRCQGARRMTR